MLPSSPMTAGVTLLIVLLLFATAFAVGRGRHKYGVAAPAVTGHPVFERLYRVQMNTLEWAVMTLPCLWIAATYVSDVGAAGLGLVWWLGRIAYALAYAADPAKRARGFTVGALAFGALGLMAGGGVIWQLIGA
ncbi:MAG: MAPEG family protein [Zoogloea sp.]|uniref:MAPEG family protein n=1 Tax=Zoogloea sp. TaxID=49181 RepID=UPI00260B8A34|nr:MAPEG family protein [Zoogloea sp.]MDD2989756.1 MAPEG family protein [Zoogloea sp.]